MSKNADRTVSTSQVLSAGIASMGAAFVTSRFGVAGTLLGAALTSMLITGSSAILKAYLDSVPGRVREVPTMIRSRREQRKAGRFAEPDTGPGTGTDTMPGRPDLRNNFVGRLRAALDWFSRLSTGQRRPILTKGLVAAAVAFVVCMGAVWAFEKVIGNNLSCGVWSACPYGAQPGVHPFGYGGTGAASSITGGGTVTGVDTPEPGLFDGGQESPILEEPVPSDSTASPAPSDSTASPTPSDSTASPDPAEEPVEPEAPGTASPAAEPAAEPEEDPSTASPAAP